MLWPTSRHVARTSITKLAYDTLGQYVGRTDVNVRCGCHERAYGTGSSRWYLPPTHLCLHSYPTTSLSLPSFLLPKSPHLFTSISLPLYLFLSAISIPLPFYPHYLSPSLYPSTSPHSSYLSAFSPSFLSTSVLYFLTPPLFLFTLIEPFNPLYPFTPSFFYLSSPFYLSTPIPLSTPRHPSLCSLNLFLLPSVRSLQPRTTLHRTVRRKLCPEP